MAINMKMKMILQKLEKWNNQMQCLQEIENAWVNETNKRKPKEFTKQRKKEPKFAWELE